MRRVLSASFAFMFVFVAMSVSVQTKRAGSSGRSQEAPSSSRSRLQARTNRSESVVQRIQRVRAACIYGRRLICGKILKVLPEGLVIESGYTNLLRAPLTRSWLLPGTVSASRAPNLVERNEPDAICVGLVFLGQIPKRRLAKARQYDYVIVKAYPDGHYTYTSVGDIHRTVRRFSFSLEAAVNHRLATEMNDETGPRGSKVK